jgi:hypothetical protein
VKNSPSKVNIVLLVTVLVFLSGTIGWLIYQNRQVEEVGREKTLPLPTKTMVVSPITTISPSPTPTVDPIKGWQTYSSDEDCFSVKYPEKVAFKMQGNLAHLSVWGPTQKKDTGFYDGISLTFSSPLVINVSLKDYVDDKINGSKEFGEIIKPREEIVVNGVKGYTYTSQGMGTFKNIYLQAEDKSCAVEITNSTVDPMNQGYQETVGKILSTFTFVK